MHFFKMRRKKVEEAVAIGKKAGGRDHWLLLSLYVLLCSFFLLPGNKLLLKFQLKAACILLSHRFYRSEVWTGINCFKVSAGYNQCQLQLNSHQRCQLEKRLLPRFFTLLAKFIHLEAEELKVLVAGQTTILFETACNFFPYELL